MRYVCSVPTSREVGCLRRTLVFLVLVVLVVDVSAGEQRFRRCGHKLTRMVGSLCRMDGKVRPNAISCHAVTASRLHRPSRQL